MALEPIRFVKNWFKNTNTREVNWDEIADKIQSFAVRSNNNFKQLGLDINGASYEFNNNGRATQSESLVDRMAAVESATYEYGTRNVGLSTADAGEATIQGSDGTAFSATNIGYVTFNETADAGDLVTRSITANDTLALQGCHWGQGGSGDLTDYYLWVLFLDDGTDAVLGVAAQGGRPHILAADCETVATSVNSIEKVYTSSAIAGTLNATYMGWIKCNFDDTGNASGEDYWSIQSGTGDINIAPSGVFFEGTFRF